jgi:hypothetical protein
VIFFDQLETLYTDDDKVSCGGKDDTLACELADGVRESPSYLLWPQVKITDFNPN